MHAKMPEYEVTAHRLSGILFTAFYEKQHGRKKYSGKCNSRNSRHDGF
jgi:hypothetical protein